MAFGVSGRVEGVEQLVALSKAVKAHADGPAIRKEMLKGLRTAARPMADSIKDTFREELPQSGGLNEWAASSAIAPRTRTSGKSAGVRITGKKAGHDLEALNSGEVRHPVFNRGGWSSTSVTPGLWEKGAEKKQDDVQAALKRELDGIASRIARSV